MPTFFSLSLPPPLMFHKQLMAASSSQLNKFDVWYLVGISIWWKSKYHSWRWPNQLTMKIWWLNLEMVLNLVVNESGFWEFPMLHFWHLWNINQCHSWGLHLKSDLENDWFVILLVTLKCFPLGLWAFVVKPSHGHVPRYVFLPSGIEDILCNIMFRMRLRTDFSFFLLKLLLEASIVMKKQEIWVAGWCECEFWLLIYFYLCDFKFLKFIEYQFLHKMETILGIT